MKENREFKINQFLTRGVIESNIEFAKTHKIPLSVVKFGYDVDLENGYFFKDLISFIHSYSDFNSILQQPNDTFLIFLRDCKIHEAKSIVSQMVKKIKFKFKVDIKHIGITLLDASDDFKSLLDRLDKYYVMSKLSKKQKIFYGTLDFDFYESQNDKKVLEKIFDKLRMVKLFNFYQGLPISEKVKIINFIEGVIQVRIEPSKMAFYENEKFTFIQHDLIPAVIKASIIKVDAKKSLMAFGKLEFLDSSPVERSGIRVEPERDIFASLSLDSKKVAEGHIVSISENSILIDLKQEVADELSKKQLWGVDLTLQFQLPTQKSFLTLIKTKANIYSIVNTKVVLHISPNSLIKSKLRNYISLRQGSLLLDLKKELKKYS
ncbi:hypothetical protein ACKGJI_09445 [Sulfurospirillum sp. 1307]